MVAKISPKAGGPIPQPPPNVPATWYYSKNHVRYGPVAVAKFKQMIETGELGGKDRVIGEGMTQWAYVDEVRDLVAAAPVPVVPIDGSANPDPAMDLSARRPALEPISYFNAAGGISGRAQSILIDFPAPTGDTSSSPLSDAQLAALSEAARHDRAMRQFNSMCNALGLIIGLCGVFPAVLGALSVGGPRRTAQSSGMAMGTVVILVGILALYIAAGRAALKARLWGPITILVLLGLNALVLLVSEWAVLRLGNSRAVSMPSGIVLLIAVALLGLLISLTIRAIRAIPRFLNSPVWCQEALVAARR